jgi:hypothetical protein
MFEETLCSETTGSNPAMSRWNWVYLQSGGAMGARGLWCDVQVQLPAALERRPNPAAA